MNLILNSLGVFWVLTPKTRCLSGATCDMCFRQAAEILISYVMTLHGLCFVGQVINRCPLMPFLPLANCTLEPSGNQIKSNQINRKVAIWTPHDPYIFFIMNILDGRSEAKGLGGTFDLRAP